MEPALVTSGNNRWVRLARALATSHGRDKHQAFLVEGVRAVSAVIALEQALVVLVDNDQLHRESLVELLHKANEVPVIRVSTAVFLTLCDTQTPQGVLAVVKDIAIPLAPLLALAPRLVVVSASIQDPGNLGTLVRIADAVGAGAVVATRGTVDLYNPKVVRATMGSLFHLPVCRDVEDGALIDELSRRGYSIVAADVQGAIAHYDLAYRPPLAVVFGNEGSGLPSLWREHAELVRIPMPGRAESLNVSVAAGVLLYEVHRQWGSQLPILPCR